MKAAGLVLVIEKRGMILSAWNRRYSTWALPGGKCEAKEEPIIAAKRELFEETGFFVDERELVPVVRAPSITGPGTIHVFLATAVSPPLDSRKGAVLRRKEFGTDLRWLRWHEIADVSMFKPFYDEHFPRGVSHFRPTEFR